MPFTIFQVVTWSSAGFILACAIILVYEIREERRRKVAPVPPPVDPVELRRVSRELERLSRAVATLAAGQEAAAQEQVSASA